jgi:predicted dithiol-disulfide oxidoreductase (DUF899 family)
MLMSDNKVVSHEEWLKARLGLLAAEKEFTRQRDALTRRRMAMPWERVEKSYQFEGPNGALSLADLFDGRSQLIVYHFMFAPDWEEGCKSCSFWADNFNGIPIHLNHRCDIDGRFARSMGQDQRLQEAHGLELPVGVVLWKRFQFRLSRVVYA